MKITLKNIWNVVSTVIVAAVVLLAVLLVGVRVLGFQVYAVLSGSMEPTYQTGSLIYVKEVDPFTLEVGEAITFMLDEETIATHRIVGVVPDEEDPTTIRFRTKGDANAHEDAVLIHYKNVIGVPKFTIPKLGYISNFIQRPPGLYYTIAMAVVLLLLSFLPDLLDDDKPPKEKKEKKKRQPHRVPSPVCPNAENAEMYEKLYGTAPAVKPPKKQAKPAPAASPSPKRGKSAPASEPPRPRHPAPLEEMSFDLEDILADFRKEP